ncbi:MAG: hypothetical protein IT201_00995 [Thermoleophilia bacterium]|nr:hypothetical protein [Thermoleophilia bacterium]
MGGVPDIGARAELVPMDAQFEEISIGLYVRDGAALVHTYSPKPGARERISFVTRALSVLGGLEPDGERVRFACGAWHAAAARRAFLEACKVDPAAPLAAWPLELADRKTGQTIRARSLGSGLYRLEAEGATAQTASRAPAVARGLAKLAELETGDDPETVRFACGRPHDALVGLLLPRALNVRAALREEEAKATRGVLVAPGAPEEPAG